MHWGLHVVCLNKRKIIRQRGILDRWPGHVKFIEVTFRGYN